MINGPCTIPIAMFSRISFLDVCASCLSLPGLVGLHVESNGQAFFIQTAPPEMDSGEKNIPYISTECRAHHPEMII